MPFVGSQQHQFIRHRFGGGFATDLSPIVSLREDETGSILLPYLDQADDVVFDLDGSPLKAPGSQRVDSTVTGTAGTNINEIFDTFLRTEGKAHTLVYAHIGTDSQIFQDSDGDLNFLQIGTGLVFDEVAQFRQLNDVIVISISGLNEDGSRINVIRSWDGTTFSTVAGGIDAHCLEVHKNRMWAGEVDGSVRFSEQLDPTDWTGAGSGTINVDQDDGDTVRALVSHRQDLIIFKGVRNGSIQRIKGSAPTGSDAFSRDTIARGVGAITPRAVTKFANDIVFLTPQGQIQALSTVEAFGDFEQLALSRPIQRFLDENLNIAALKYSWALDVDTRGCVLFGLPTGSSTRANVILCMDYRFAPVRWSRIRSIPTPLSAALVDDVTFGKEMVWFGGTSDNIDRWGISQSRYTDDSGTGAAIDYQWRTPFIDYAIPWQAKTFAGGGLGFTPENNGSITFRWRRDSNAAQSATVSTSPTAVLGAAGTNQFTLGTSRLGGPETEFHDRFFTEEEGGEFRAIQYEVQGNTIDEDVRIHSLTSILEGGPPTLEDNLL